jgi:hypothetical protein
LEKFQAIIRGHCAKEVHKMLSRVVGQSLYYMWGRTYARQYP